MSEEITYYESYKERDLLLEYTEVDTENIPIVNILDTGIENISRIQAVAKIMTMVNTKKVYHIMCMNPYKIMRIRSNNDLNIISKKADMHLACGSGIDWAAKTLKTPLKEKISSLSFMMDIIRISELKEYTIFLVGGKPEVTERAYFNIKKSFPKIRIVGRHGGYFNPDREKSVVEAMRKSEAHIIFVGLGFPKEDQWIYKNKKEFSNTIIISVGGNIDIISGEVRKAPAFFMSRGLDWFYRIIIRPWRWGRLIRILLFAIQVLYKRFTLK